MSTEGSKYVNKEIKNALKEVKQIKTLIEQSNEERKSLLSSLEEAKKKKEVRKSQVPPPPHPLCRGEGLAVAPLDGLPGCQPGCHGNPQSFQAVSADPGAVVNKQGRFICF